MKKKRFMTDDELVKKWEKGRWYSPEGEKIAIAAYKHLEEEDKKRTEPFDFDAYCDNIREAFKSLAEAFDDMKDMDITVKENKEEMKKK